MGLTKLQRTRVTQCLRLLRGVARGVGLAAGGSVGRTSLPIAVVRRAIRVGIVVTPVPETTLRLQRHSVCISIHIDLRVGVMVRVGTISIVTRAVVVALLRYTVVSDEPNRSLWTASGSVQIWINTWLFVPLPEYV